MPLVSFPGIPFRLTHLEKAAYTFLCPGGLRTEDCSDGLVKHRLEAALRQSRAFEVFHGVCWEESRCCNGEEGNWGRQWGYPGICCRGCSEEKHAEGIPQIASRRKRCMGLFHQHVSGSDHFTATTLSSLSAHFTVS